MQTMQNPLTGKLRADIVGPFFLLWHWSFSLRAFNSAGVCMMKKQQSQAIQSTFRMSGA